MGREYFDSRKVMKRMPKVDERILALEAKLKQLKVVQQRKEARAHHGGEADASSGIAAQDFGGGYRLGQK
jgi:hypothetical protein